jgi:hypothetical protein
VVTMGRVALGGKNQSSPVGAVSGIRKSNPGKACRQKAPSCFFFRPSVNVMIVLACAI